MTDEKPSIFELMQQAMTRVQAVGKNDRNSQQNYSFRGIDAVINAVGPVFRELGVVAIPHKSQAHYRDVQTSQGKPSRECTVTVTYRFYGPAGDYIEAEVPGESMDFGDKGAPKAMSVAYRICLLQSLCIPTDEADPDSQSYERAAPPEPVTDFGWLDGFKVRLTAAGTAGEVRGLIGEAQQMHREGHLAGDDARELKRLTDERLEELSVPA
jgi:hypothetical protein